MGAWVWEGDVGLAVSDVVAVAFPGIVSALTTARPATPVSAPTATPAVKRFSFRKAASRDSAAAWIVFRLCMMTACSPPLNRILEQA